VGSGRMTFTGYSWADAVAIASSAISFFIWIVPC
jgi:hypothetical protein